MCNYQIQEDFEHLSAYTYISYYLYLSFLF